MDLMRPKIFLTGLVAVMMLLLSCNRENKNSSIKGGQLQAIAKTETSDNEENTVVFTGEDIKSFNGTTREIIFTDLVTEKLGTSLHFSEMTVYLNEEKLFNTRFTNPLMSWSINDLVFYIDFLETDNKNVHKFYLKDGYPEISDVWENKEIIRAEREMNAKSRENEWNTFITFLKENGKYIE